MHIPPQLTVLFQAIIAHKIVIAVGVLLLGAIPVAGVTIINSQIADLNKGEQSSEASDTESLAGPLKLPLPLNEQGGDTKKQPTQGAEQKEGQAPAKVERPKSTGSTSGSKNSSTSPSSSPSPSPAPAPTCQSGYGGTYPACYPLPLGIAGSWNLIMQDEFSGSSLNAMWSTQRGPSYSYGNPYNASIEDAWYLANNPKVQDGKLVLTLNQGATNGYPYSSGMVQNGRSWTYKYGYIEARVKVPGNIGVWPAFWTLPAPVDSTWPPEIDVFEFGLQSQTRPSFNYHYGTSPNNYQRGLEMYGSSNVDYSQDYHTYGMLWTAQKIQVYIDGQAGPSYTNMANITNMNQYTIFNLALKKGYTVPSGTAMYVDYIRVWQ